MTQIYDYSYDEPEPFPSEYEEEVTGHLFDWDPIDIDWEPELPEIPYDIQDLLGV